PDTGIAGAIVEQVQLRVVGIPAPRRATTPLPLVSLPRRDAEILALIGGIGRLERLVGDQHLVVRTSAVTAPETLAIGRAVRRDAAAHAELAAGNAGDDHIAHDERCVGHGLAFLVVRVVHAEDLL